MKKQILIATGLAVLSTSAFASKARLEALGQNDDRGSFYVEDSRNIFRNAAKVNTFKNYITTEWGTASNTTDDTTTAPHAEGGFFREMGSFNYGVYMGSQIDSQNSARNTEDSALQDHDNSLDLFFGGDMGVQWGARVHYASGNTENAGTHELEHSNFGLGLGMMMGDIEGYANIILSDESKGGTASVNKFEANGLNLGASYNLNGTKIYVDYDADGYDYTTTTKKEVSNTALTVGAGRIHEVSSTARLNMDIAFVSYKNEVKTTSTVETKDTTLPLTLGFEADATSWLTLRGSVSQNIIINNREVKSTTTNKNTKANTTNVSAGATLNFGKLKVDGSIGTTDSNRAATTSAETGTLALDNVLTRVGVTYWF